MVLRTALLFATLFALTPARARAETVLFACSESCPISLFEALELELRGHGVFLVARLSPSGFTVDAHEADARRMALAVPAGAVLWVEREDPLRVRVLAPKQTVVREAPLAQAPEVIEARVFAAIAGNVVLQALGAPGHADPTAEVTNAPAPAQAAAAPPPAAASQPISRAEQQSWLAKNRDKPTRFFLRAGAAIGAAFLKPGMKSDRPPSSELVSDALRAQIEGGGDPQIGEEYLEAAGYDCDWRAGSQVMSFVAANCNVAVDRKGWRLTPGIDLAAGAHVTPRLAFALALRITPGAGYGNMNHALLGAQAEYTLTEPRPTGFWANVGFGLGGGLMQVRPKSDVPNTPYATGGPAYAQLITGVGYRFSRYIGLYLTPSVRLLFPDTMWMLEPNMGLEGRL